MLTHLYIRFGRDFLLVILFLITFQIFVFPEAAISQDPSDFCSLEYSSSSEACSSEMSSSETSSNESSSSEMSSSETNSSEASSSESSLSETSSSEASSSESSSSETNSSESNSSESSSSDPYICCIAKIQKPADTICGALDQAQCEHASTNGTEGSPNLYICAWNQESGSCENIFENECKNFVENKDCDYSETRNVTWENIDIDLAPLPEECYKENAEIREQYCGHGKEEICEDYFSQIDNLIPPEPNTGYCITIGSDACSLFGNQEEALSIAQSVCTNLSSKGAGNFEINISGNQCSAIMKSDGTSIPEFSTPLSICITNNNVSVTYPPCQTECHSLQKNESMQCLENPGDSEPIEMTCCPKYGNLLSVDENGKPTVIKYIIGGEWIEGETCEDDTPSTRSSSGNN